MTNVHAGIPVLASNCKCDALNPVFRMSTEEQEFGVDSQISHHTAALSSASLDQIMVLIAVEKLIRNSHIANMKAPVFKDILTILNKGMTASAQAIRLAMGTSGYVGSIVLDKLTQKLKARASPELKARRAKGQGRILMRTMNLKSFYSHN